MPIVKRQEPQTTRRNGQSTLAEDSGHGTSRGKVRWGGCALKRYKTSQLHPLRAQARNHATTPCQVLWSYTSSIGRCNNEWGAAGRGTHPP